MEFTVETNIAKPKPIRTSAGRTSKYPFLKLTVVGASFKVPYDNENKEDRKKIERSVRQAVLSFKKKNTEFNLSTINVLGSSPDEKDGKDGLRVYRDPSVEAAPKEPTATA